MTLDYTKSCVLSIHVQKNKIKLKKNENTQTQNI